MEDIRQRRLLSLALQIANAAPKIEGMSSKLVSGIDPLGYNTWMYRTGDTMRIPLYTPNVDIARAGKNWLCNFERGTSFLQMEDQLRILATVHADKQQTGEIAPQTAAVLRAFYQQTGYAPEHIANGYVVGGVENRYMGMLLGALDGDLHEFSRAKNPGELSPFYDFLQRPWDMTDRGADDELYPVITSVAAINDSISRMLGVRA
ncbi:MAG: hypothetical protein TR69_WS6001001121 [candidate division WS6 bacterium OLB20]|uniref:Uncharacterized protein n=1 Tax=candidate division WS6 bacterium OLB20 TaxID=1617426 RepID=A0A136LZL9_9BACT|nr:MAG: hypothetical protein TR69_WS6001001121 [candidate division WS6 bacterium OLB20]